MGNRLTLFVRFIGRLFYYALHVRELMASLVLLMIGGGVLISRLESIELGNAIYFAFITGLSIGYGDITPDTVAGKIVSVGIGMIGMLFVGLTVAIATRAMADIAEESDDANA